MENRHGGSFADKHKDFQPEARLKNEVLEKSKNGELACAVAFDIAGALDISIDQVGKTADVLDLRLVKCRLGLFGYGEKKRLVKSLERVEPDMEAAIRDALAAGRLACNRAWEIAARFDVPKLTVGNACETLGIKIKPCQLGAF